MMTDFSWLERTEILLGEEALKALAGAHVMVIGMGGVGSFAAEFICRAGVGKMTIVDGDTVDSTNRNRQLPALSSTIGKSKVGYMAERLKDINPELDLIVLEEFLQPERAAALITPDLDYVVDCIDSIKPKLWVMETCVRRKVRLISSMGAGGKVDPHLVQTTDISKSVNCPFAGQIKKKLKEVGIRNGIKVVFSSEAVSKATMRHTSKGGEFKKSFYGTISYIPALFGIHCAAQVIRGILHRKKIQLPS